MKFLVIDEEDFNENIDLFDGSFYQTSNWAKIKAFNDWTYEYVMIKDNNKVVGISLLLKKKIFLGKYLYYAPRGLLVDYKNYKYVEFFTLELKKYLKKNNGFILKIDPRVERYKKDKDNNIIDDSFNNDDVINNLKKLGYKHFGFKTGYTDEFQCRWSYALPIKNKTIDELYKEMNRDWRYFLRKGWAYPLIVKEVNDDLTDYKEIMDHTTKRQHRYDRSLSYYEKIVSEFKDNVRVIVVYLDKKAYLEKYDKNDKLYEEVIKLDRNMIPISTGLFINYNGVTNYVYGGTIKSLMKSMAQYISQYDMIKYGTEHNYEVHDFGGITGDFNPNSYAYGVYYFKRGFGGHVVEYIGEFDLIINNWVNLLYKIGLYVYRFCVRFLGKIKLNKN